MTFGEILNSMTKQYDLSPLFKKKQDDSANRRMQDAYEKKEKDKQLTDEQVKYREKLEEVLEELQRVTK